jgi:hypothetical protein
MQPNNKKTRKNNFLIPLEAAYFCMRALLDYNCNGSFIYFEIKTNFFPNSKEGQQWI